MGKILSFKLVCVLIDMVLLNMLTFDGLLTNVLTMQMVKSSSNAPNYSSNMRVYKIQELLCLMSIAGLVYLLLITFLRPFLIVSDLSAYLIVPLSTIRKILFTLVPAFILALIVCFAVNVFYNRDLYAPPAELYHKLPAKLMENNAGNLILGETSPFQIIVNSIRNRIEDIRAMGNDNDDDEPDDNRARKKPQPVLGRQLNKLPWLLIKLKRHQYFYLQAKVYKLIVVSALHVFLHVCLFVKLNVCSFFTCCMNSFLDTCIGRLLSCCCSCCSSCNQPNHNQAQM